MSENFERSGLGNQEDDTATVERVAEVDESFRKPLNSDLLADIDQRLVDLLDPSGEALNTAETQEEKSLIDLIKDLRGGETGSNRPPRSLDAVFLELRDLPVREKKSRLKALRTFSDAMNLQATSHDETGALRRVAELTRLRTDMATAELFLKNPKYSVGQKQNVSRSCRQRFIQYAENDDIPLRFKEELKTAADWLDTHNPERAHASETVALAFDSSKKLFGREGGVKKDDLEGIQYQIERLTYEPTPKNIFEVAKLLAQAKRAGIRLADGHESMRQFIEQGREVMYKKGPRILAQYLTYGKYNGLIQGATHEEELLIMDTIHERVADVAHKGLTRLSMNAHFLELTGYSSSLVQQGVLEEIEDLRAAGDWHGVAAEVDKARQAGVELRDVSVEILPRLTKRLAGYAEHDDWDGYAKLRNILERSWNVGAQGYVDNASSELLFHFYDKREHAQAVEEWGDFVTYAADVRELSERQDRRQGVLKPQNLNLETLQVDREKETMVDVEEEKAKSQAIVNKLRNYDVDGHELTEEDIVLWNLYDEVEDEMGLSASYAEFVVRNSELNDILVKNGFDPEGVWRIMRPRREREEMAELATPEQEDEDFLLTPLDILFDNEEEIPTSPATIEREEPRVLPELQLPSEQPSRPRKVRRLGNLFGLLDR